MWNKASGLGAVGHLDKRGVRMAEWSDMQSLQLFQTTSREDEGLYYNLEGQKSVLREQQGDREYGEMMATTVMQITELMEVLLKRAILAETELEFEKEKSSTSQDEVFKKTDQIARMWARNEEMEMVALGTSGVLKEMQVKLENMEQETLKQRQRAAENEQELSRVRHDFGFLQSSHDHFVKGSEKFDV